MDIITNPKEMQQHSDKMRTLGKKVVLIPTMGCLHQGHLSLIEKAKEHGDYLIASIFVNPTQFGPTEDLDSYPGDLKTDLALLERMGTDAVFTPAPSSIYGKNFQTYVTLVNIPHHLCGISRPEHFRGVATVVTKLFNIIKPHAAIFGLKDFQQLALIEQMNSDLNFGIKIIGAPIVREKDGLAMSSRNTYLDPAQRNSATCLHRSIQRAQRLLKKGEKNTNAIIDEISKIITAEPQTAIDYIEICDPETFEAVLTIKEPALLAMAVKFGEIRLIDNAILNPT